MALDHRHTEEQHKTNFRSLCQYLHVKQQHVTDIFYPESPQEADHTSTNLRYSYRLTDRALPDISKQKRSRSRAQTTTCRQSLAPKPNRNHLFHGLQNKIK